MRLNFCFWRWSLKQRFFLTIFIWLAVAMIAFFCSPTGHRFKIWINDMYHLVTDKTHCTLAQVSVKWQEENHYTKTEEILSAIHVNPGIPMSQINLDEMRQTIERLPWIRSAVVERYWPNHIKITIKEKVPLALWQNNQKYRPLDEFAEVIPTTEKLPADLLLVVGSDAPKHLLSLLENLQQVPEIDQYVRSATRIGERRWNLKLFDGLEILLPEENILEALIRLDTRNKNEQILKRQIASIDLRTHGKVILKPLTPSKSKPKQKEKKK